ncbi:DNA-binding protein [Pannonibacter sp. CS1GBFMT1]|uniref:helix-turn-helix domain-containing transcriptional regulator n=1 Tax=Pannonibacter sp. CS1GBFMT1 TaxID=2003581 RepID=UPI001648A186|nr:hypothetical protein [Pannonibacter sp. CS1GBFMT1]
MALETTRFDIQQHLQTPQAQSGYLEAALKDGDPALIAAAIVDVARARAAAKAAGNRP